MPTDRQQPQSSTAIPPLYALLVGINGYEGAPLSGCLNDIERILTYLQRQGVPAEHICQLTDANATKAAIVDAFRNHLAQAGSSDTVLFYFSGHGAQELADPLWDETDGRLECLVCYNGHARQPADFLLADKELRYLIHELSRHQAHIVTIFDCCHSGDNTRNAPLLQTAFSTQTVCERRLSRAFPQRDYAGFLFSDALPLNAIAGQPPAKFLPEGAHIQLAACEPDESAVEIGGAGVFTTTLLRVLADTGGLLTYHVLNGRIRQYMRFVYEQQPRLRVVGDQQGQHRPFLNGSATARPVIGEAIYNPQNGWLLTVGGLHGLTPGQPVQLLDPAYSHQTISVLVAEVFADYALLSPGDPVLATLNPNLTYAVQGSGLMTYPLSVFLHNHDGHPRQLQKLTDALLTQTNGLVELATGENEADYTVHVRRGMVYLTQPGDVYRPIVRPEDADETGNPTIVAEWLRHLSRWHFVQKLRNTDAQSVFAGAEPVQITVEEIQADGSVKVLPATHGTVLLTYRQAGDGWVGRIRIRLTNQVPQKIYVAVGYGQRDYSVFMDFLPQRVEPLAPTGEAGDSVTLSLAGDPVIDLQLPDVIRDYNWPQFTEFLTVIVSTEPFNADALLLDELPEPVTLDEAGVFKAGGFKTVKKLPPAGWTVQSRLLTFINPLHNRVEPDRLDRMLEHGEMAGFAMGLYFDVKTDEHLQPTALEYKPELTVVNSVDQQSLWSDVRPGLGNLVETAQRKRRYEKLRNSGRIRIVAAGDSWFQYPMLVRDVLDQLSGLYAVRSFAAAGNTLRSSFDRLELMDALVSEQPEFFLISGGGTDILGEPFRDFLADPFDPAVPVPQRYVRDTFTAELRSLVALYRRLFIQLTTDKRLPATLHILVHGYDYVIPMDTTVPDNTRKTSWLGQYLVQCNVIPQSGREAVLRFIIDAFNQELRVVADEFPGRVSYLDVRGTVTNCDYWYDEIHPNDKGFQDVAMRFAERIQHLKAH